MHKTNDFVRKFYPFAKTSEIETGIPATFTLAQGAIESAWGEKAIGNNIFGITAGNSWSGKKQLVKTTEYLDGPNHSSDFLRVYSITPPHTPGNKTNKYKYIVDRWFRDYDDIQQCFDDHFKVLLDPRYKEAFKYKSDAKKFASEIAKAGYATGTNYQKLLHSVIDSVVRIIGFEELEKMNGKDTEKFC